MYDILPSHVYYEGRTIGRPPKRVAHRGGVYRDDRWIYDRTSDHDPNVILSFLIEDFDVFLHWDSSGPMTIAFRVPGVSVDAMRPYLVGDARHGVTVQVSSVDAVVQISRDAEWDQEDEFDEPWAEMPGEWLDLLLPLRDDLAAGDMSALYLGWRMVAGEEVGDGCEPPLPPRIAALEEYAWPETAPALAALDRILRPEDWDPESPEGWPLQRNS
ncbi:hypothetical protein ACFYT4_34390 [Streptomyces sp. NPDC004609]|uniref:hypothetical protein n=1 Tax=Streptomyces sp. NPDC004609 TaxID=3364704 RepID=UPI0036B87DB4